MTIDTTATIPATHSSSLSTTIDKNPTDEHRIRSNSKSAPPFNAHRSQRNHLTTNPYKGFTSSSDRTLVHLIGNNVPSLSLESIRKNSLPRTSSPSTSSSNWVLAPFENPARKDGLQLKHWVRTDDHEVYRFAKYNTTSNVYSYTTQEYYHLLRDDDWTKEETDYLFDLLNAYDLRFPVVHDRYEFLGSRERSLDDLKSRYYSICQKLIQHRPSTTNSSQGEDSNKKQLMQYYNFDKQREIERKKHVKSLLSRTPAQLLEEEFIYIETRRIEQNLLKRVRNRDELMKLIGGAQYHMLNELKFWPVIEPSATTQQLSRLSIGNHSQNSTGLSSQPQSAFDNRSIHLKKRNSRKSETLEETPPGVNLAGGEETEANSDISKPIDPEAQIQHDKKNCIYRLGSSSFGGSSHASAHHHRSVGLRSTRITLPKTTAASTRLSAVMNELKIPTILNYLPKPLIMPTRENVESYERLIQATHQLIDLKRIADRVESDLKAHRKKKESLMSTLSTSNAPKTTTPCSGEGTTIIDPARAPSVDDRSPKSPDGPATAPPLPAENDEDPSRPFVDSSVDPSRSTTNHKKRSASVSSGSCSTAASPQNQRTTTTSNPSRKKIRKN